MFIGERYRVVAQNTDVITSHKIFYGTCYSITPTGRRFVKIKFIDLTNRCHNPISNVKWIVIDLNDPLYSNGWILMKLMEPELTREIKRYKKMKIPSLLNLCRKSISNNTRIEYQGTYISDVIEGIN
jgi:hypothetical protein